MGDTLGFVSLYSHAWECTISTNRLMTVRASSAHGTAKKKMPAARLKVSASRGNLSGASASHNTAIAAQQHGVIPASQLLPMVS